MDALVRKDIQNRLKAAMAERGLSSAPELAQACGLKESTARAYLNGTRTPPLDVCVQIGRGLGVSGNWLFYGKGPREGERAAIATPSDLIFAAVEEALLAAGLQDQTAQAIAGVIQLILDAHPRAPRGMSQQEAVRRLVRIHLSDVLPPPKA